MRGEPLIIFVHVQFLYFLNQFFNCIVFLVGVGSVSEGQVTPIIFALSVNVKLLLLLLALTLNLWILIQLHSINTLSYIDMVIFLIFFFNCEPTRCLTDGTGELAINARHTINLVSDVSYLIEAAGADLVATREDEWFNNGLDTV